MLEKLYIKNFAIVDELIISFSPGFQVITGETGAGKSILVGAIALICGDRGTSDYIRSNMKQAIIEGLFKIKNNHHVKYLLDSWNIPYTNDELILRRELNVKGNNRAFINETSVSIANLTELSGYLIDLHGQHQHQRLLYPENHINYLDAYGNLTPMLETYREIYHTFMGKTKELDTLQKKQQEIKEKESLYRFQLQELEQANLIADEYETLCSEQTILENSEFLYEATKKIGERLYNASDSALNQLTETLNTLSKLAEIDKAFATLIKDLESAQIAVEDAGMFCETYGENLNFDPERLNELRERRSHIEWLLKKYNQQTVNHLIAHKAYIETQLSYISGDEEHINRLQDAINQHKNQLQKRAFALSELRHDIAQTFSLELNKRLENVGLPNANFFINLYWRENSSGLVTHQDKQYMLDQNGLDCVEFMIGINPGEPPRPLHKIASGGEISRIMLCLKSLLAATDKIPTLIFDEIDIGISGRIAQTVGQRMYEIGKAHQLIVISHLPQIAAQGTTQFSVRKEEKDGRVHVTVEELSPENRVLDLAKLLGGEKITEQMIANARALLKLVQH
jgi:DNA repair protein RecN (Recombination protein N)